MTPPEKPVGSFNRGEITSTRLLPAERNRVFDAHRDPVRLAAWWGPRGCRNVFEEFDFRAGGTWRFTMHGPDGATYPMNHQFSEIVILDRITVRHLQAGHDFTLAIVLTPLSAGTEVTWRMRFDDPDEGEKLRSFLEAANQENLDRLADHLATFP